MTERIVITSQYDDDRSTAGIESMSLSEINDELVRNEEADLEIVHAVVAARKTIADAEEARKTLHGRRYALQMAKQVLEGGLT